MKYTQQITLATVLFLLYTPISADDTDIFFTTDDNVDRKVMVIFDNSGSMAEKDNQGISKIATAKKAFTSIVDDNPNVKFGLEIFNTTDGGHTKFAMPSTMTAKNRLNLKKIVNALIPETWTPLSETLYETLLYLGGHAINFGKSSVLTAKKNKTTYKSPMTFNKVGPKSCDQINSVILMTDGLPTQDNDSKADIQKLPNMTGKCNGNCLDELAGWMYDSNIMSGATYGDPIKGRATGNQHNIVTHTIGFLIKSSLLQDTATAGHGSYFEADNVDNLRKAFQMAISSVIDTNATMASPAIPLDSDNMTKTLDDIYIPMFLPTKSAFWPGNLKKFKLNQDGEVASTTTGTSIIDPTTGQIIPNARTAWGDASGGDVPLGGVGNKLSKSRIFYSNFGTKNNGGPTKLSHASYFGSSTIKQMNAYIDAVKQGFMIDVTVNGVNVKKRWAMGDIIHSTPLVINYGNNDVRVLVGTNQGLLHMFNGANGYENWAFYPKELAKNFKILSNPSNPHPYGIDGSPVAYIKDSNHNRDLTDPGDEVWAFFGLRRGGHSYYGLDISNPNGPKVTSQWTITKKQFSGFFELGQSWSTPAVGLVPRTKNATDPALIFAAGYDVNKDAPGIGTHDTEGRGIFIVDAKTGKLIRAFTRQKFPEPNNINQANLTDSMPAPVATMDSNGDGVIDRIYVGDTSANIWRMDLIGTDSSKWTLFKFAALGNDDPNTSGIQHDRRIFNQIDVVRTKKNGLLYDALLVGTGNRANPNDTSVSDRFYMLRDYNILPMQHSQYPKICDLNIALCHTSQTTITNIHLYNATSNVIQDGSVTEKANEKAALYQTDPNKQDEWKYGWYIDLDGGDGETSHPKEKSLGVSTTLNGTVYFTTYMPPTDDEKAAAKKQCRGAEGKSYLWGVNIHDASAVHANWDNDNTLTSITDRKQVISLGGGPKGGFATNHNDKTSLNVPKKISTGSSLRTGSVYWYKGE